MQFGIFVAVLFLGSVLGIPTYRTDYEYNKKTKAFYKLNLYEVYIGTAKDICKMEGAQLMVPSSKEDIAMLHAMMKTYPDMANLVWVGDDGETHYSAEEIPMIDLQEENDKAVGSNVCDVINRDGEIETATCFRNRPFVCKVEEKDAVYDEQCGVYGSGYKYYASVNSCYKVLERALIWNGGYAECLAQGAHLAIINSEAEHLVIKEFLQTAPKLAQASAQYFYFAGIRANRPADKTDKSPRVFRTIFNQTLEEAGYSGWSDGEPNNYMDNEYCGSIFTNNGKYNDVDCHKLFGVICEKEVPTK